MKKHSGKEKPKVQICPQSRLYSGLPVHIITGRVYIGSGDVDRGAVGEGLCGHGQVLVGGEGRCHSPWL